jgi:hypothetical protein
MKPEYAYASQKRKSAIRGIEFLLSFDQWWTIWQTSGHWENRGRGKGRYHMARHGDIGPYAEGNVSIIPCEQNISEANKGRKMPPRTEEHRRRISEAKRGRKMGPRSEETKRKISAANTGKRRSPEVIEKMRKAATGSHPNVSAKVRRQRAALLRKRNKSIEMRRKVSAALKGTKAWMKRTRDGETGQFA